jgi:hypothetical protein
MHDLTDPALCDHQHVSALQRGQDAGQGGTIRLRPGLLLAEYPVCPSRLQRGDLCIKRLT